MSIRDFLSQATIFPNGIKERDITISASQILSWFSNPIELIPAPGRSKVIFPMAFRINTVFNTIDFQDENSVDIYTDLSSPYVSAGINPIIDALFLSSFTAIGTLGQSLIYFKNMLQSSSILTTPQLANLPLLSKMTIANPNNKGAINTFAVN